MFPNHEADEYVRRLLFPILVGLAIGFGLSLLPSPFDVIAVLLFAVIGVAYCVWALVDTHRWLRGLEQDARRGAAYLASLERHKRA